MRVDDRWRPELDASAVDGDVPVLEVDLLVVHLAKQATVRDRGLAAVDPVRRVVRIARPTSSGSESLPITTGISLQSHASRRALLALISCP